MKERDEVKIIEQLQELPSFSVLGEGTGGYYVKIPTGAAHKESDPGELKYWCHCGACGHWESVCDIMQTVYNNEELIRATKYSTILIFGIPRKEGQT